MLHRDMMKDMEELVRLLSLKKSGSLRDYLASTTEKGGHLRSFGVKVSFIRSSAKPCKIATSAFFRKSVGRFGRPLQGFYGPFTPLAADLSTVLPLFLAASGMRRGQKVLQLLLRKPLPESELFCENELFPIVVVLIVVIEGLYVRGDLPQLLM